MFLNCCNVVRKSNICLSLYYGLMALFYQSLNKFYLKYLNFYAFQFLEFAVKLVQNFLSFYLLMKYKKKYYLPYSRGFFQSLIFDIWCNSQTSHTGNGERSRLLYTIIYVIRHLVGWLC